MEQRAALEKRVKGKPDAEVLTTQLAESRAARAAADAARQAHTAAVKSRAERGRAVTELDRTARECAAAVHGPA